MKFLVVALFALITPAFSRPQAPPQAAPPQPATQPRSQSNPQGGSNVTPVSIVSQTEVVGPDGSFNYSYDTSNGIHFEQGGYVKKAAEARAVDPNNPDATGDVQVIQGAYSYTAPDGQQISLRYVADDNGFQPEGEHLPKAPEGIARGLEQQQGQPQQAQPLQQQQQRQSIQPLPQTLQTQQPQVATSQTTQP